MTEAEQKEFFTKFTKVVGDTTKHYEFKDVDPLEVFGWIEAYKNKEVQKALKTAQDILVEIYNGCGENAELFMQGVYDTVLGASF